MIRLYILCEGQTEEMFVNKILANYFEDTISLIPIVIATKRTAYRKYKGGIKSYGKIKKEIEILCKEHKNEFVTTMIDYYGLPEDTPGISISTKDIYETVNNLENVIFNDINFDNFIPYISMHEFEALLFSNCDAFQCRYSLKIFNELLKVRSAYLTPEHINDSKETAPSKRIINIVKENSDTYSKITDSLSILKVLSFESIRDECKHFNLWIEKIKYLC